MKFLLFSDGLHFSLIYHCSSIGIFKDSSYILIYGYLDDKTIFYRKDSFRFNYGANIQFKHIRTPDNPRFFMNKIRSNIVVKKNFFKYQFINTVIPEYFRLVKENIKL